MFREMRRQHQALTMEESIEVLKSEKRGVLSVIGDDGYPYGLPIDHIYYEEDGKIYFHSGKVGHRVDAMKACNKASFCVYKYTGNDPAPNDWIENYHCVHMFGTIQLIEDVDEIERICRDISHKFTDDEKYIDDEVKSALKGTLCFVLTPEHITGKKIHEC